MINVGVIGLGAISAGYSGPNDKNPYCHLGGILKSPQAHLAAVADVSEEARSKYQTKWSNWFPQASVFASAETMLKETPIDVVAVCVRGPYHFEIMQQVLAARPKLIFLEKPPTCSLAEMDALVAAARERNIPITVSYSRHWTPHILRLEQLVKGGLIGEVKSVVGYNGGSFLSFISHTTDLLCQFAGYEPKAVFARGHADAKSTAPEGFEIEPIMDAMVIEFAGGVIGTQVGAAGEFGQFYAEVHGTEGMVRAGMYTPAVAKGKDGKPIDLSRQKMPAEASVFEIAYEQIADYLHGGPLPACTNEHFIAVNEIGFAGIESSISGLRVTLPNANRSRKIFANG